MSGEITDKWAHVEPRMAQAPRSEPHLRSTKAKDVTVQSSPWEQAKTDEDSEDGEKKLVDSIFGSRYLDNIFNRLDDESAASPKFKKVSKEELDRTSVVLN